MTEDHGSELERNQKWRGSRTGQRTGTATRAERDRTRKDCSSERGARQVRAQADDGPGTPPRSASNACARVLVARLLRLLEHIGRFFIKYTSDWW